MPKQDLNDMELGQFNAEIKQQDAEFNVRCNKAGVDYSLDLADENLCTCND